MSPYSSVPGWPYPGIRTAHHLEPPGCESMRTESRGRKHDAVIISANTAVKGPMPSPKVPGIVPICRATTTLPSQAGANPVQQRS
jgi:hypothetical protein